MPFAPGKVLGPYEIVEKAGAGGMGEVFKAQDNRLERVVAIKVLPPTVAANPELRQRFEREAKSISSLNHPNICTLYDIGHEDGLEYLVMEYIEGETLSDRIKRGPLPMDELFRIAYQIADALDKAHGQGLIHRDLKPANVMLTSTGAKLLDFGLAKIKVSEGHVEGVSGITQSTPLTGTGTILGTLQYMSPEQLEGKDADARSDIFAFGATLYEMATGQRAFEGQSQASLIAGIIERDPASVTSLNPMAPPALARLIKKCLDKNPEARWQSARDLADELSWIAQSGSQVGLPAQVAARRRFRFRLGWTLSAVAAIVALCFAYLWFSREIPNPNVLRFKISTRKDLSQVSWPCLSPDGKSVAFQAIDADGNRLLWIRPLNSLESYSLIGTEGAGRPFWSPDSKYLAFNVGRRQLKKIPAAGGPVQLICETDGGSDGTWGSSGYIIYDAGPGDSLFVVAAAGGTPTPLLGIDREAGEVTHIWPWFLPDGVHYLYLAEMSENANIGGNYLLMVGNTKTLESKSLFPVDGRVQYSDPGYLVYFRKGILLAQKFDSDKLEAVGDAIPLTDEVSVGDLNRAEFGLSNQGILAYQTNASMLLSRLVWVDRTGKELGQIGESGSYRDFALSPDQERLAICVFDGEQSDIWVYDLERHVKTRITFEESDDGVPYWSRDGNYIYYSNDKSGKFGLFKRAANGLGETVPIYADDSMHAAVESRSLDGKWLYGVGYVKSYDVVRYSPTDKSYAEIIFGSKYQERGPRISPDGNYLAYYSNESGQYEVYVLELKEGGGRWQISSDGGRCPQWSEDGTELYFITPNWDLIAIPITTSGKFMAGKPDTLFNRKLNFSGFVHNRFEPTRDKDKFILTVPAISTGGGEFNVVVNWPEEVENQ